MDPPRVNETCFPHPTHPRLRVETRSTFLLLSDFFEVLCVVVIDRFFIVVFYLFSVKSIQSSQNGVAVAGGSK